jgi:hypothetical protein
MTDPVRSACNAHSAMVALGTQHVAMSIYSAKLGRANLRYPSVAIASG